MLRKKIVMLGLSGALLVGAVGLTSAQGGDNQRLRDRVQDRDHHIVETVAEAINLSVDDILAQLQEGATLTEIIEANGGDADAIVEQLVDEWLLTREQVRARLTETLNNGFNRDFSGRFGRGPLAPIADLLTEYELDPMAVRQQLVDGVTLAEILEEAGVNIDDFTTSATQLASDRFAELVEAGTISQEVADARLVLMTEHLTAMINGDYQPMFGQMGDRGNFGFDQNRNRGPRGGRS